MEEADHRCGEELRSRHQHFRIKGALSCHTCCFPAKTIQPSFLILARPEYIALKFRSKTTVNFLQGE